MHQNPEHTDKVVFLLSTDWFCSYVSLLGLWNDVSDQSVRAVKGAAEASSMAILGKSSSYFEVDLSDERKARSFETFVSHAKSAIGRSEFEALKLVVEKIQGSGLLSDAQSWALKYFFLSEVLSGFQGDTKNLVDPQLRASIGEKIEQLDGLRSSVDSQSRWEVALADRFAGMTTFLSDFAESVFLPNVFSDYLAQEVSQRKWSQEKVWNLCEWIASGLASTGVAADADLIASVLRGSGTAR